MKRLITLFALMLMFAIGAQAQIVGANEGPKAKTSNTTSSLYKPTGHYLRFEAGFPNLFTMAYGYQITSNLMIGAGGGIGEITYRYSHWSRLGIGFPLFTEVIVGTPKQDKSIYLDFKVGANIPQTYRYDSSHYWNGRILYSAVNIGFSIGNVGIFGGVSTNSRDMLFSVGVSYNMKVH